MKAEPRAESPVNCHFISRFLTAPWEFGERQLNIVDVETKTLSQRSSRNLFALRGLNTARTEERLNKLVETPVAQYRRTCAAGSPSEEIPWDVHRALFLIVLLQLPRVVEAAVGKSSVTLEDVLAHTDAELASLVRHYEQSRALSVVTTPHDVLLYPSSGAFFVPVKPEGVSTVFDYGVAIPLDRKLLALMVPKGADTTYLLQFTTKPGWFTCRSASIDRLATKVVVAPDVVDQAPNPSLIVDNVLECQGLNRTIMEGIIKVQGLFGEAARIAGLTSDASGARRDES